MKVDIQLKLFATLAPYLPAGARENRSELDVEDGETVAGLLSRFRLPADLVHLVMVNGHYLDPERRETERLEENDVVAVFPPVAGG